MSQTVLNDKNVAPNDDIIFSIIGDRQLLWKQTISYLCDNNNDISEEWKYYNDGKSWLFWVINIRMKLVIFPAETGFVTAMKTPFLKYPILIL